MLTFNDLLRATIIAKCDAVIEPTPENVALAASFDRITRAVATDMIFDTVYQRRIFKAEPKPKAPEYTEGQAYADNGGKMKANPYEGGSDEWWSWHNGYKDQKTKIEADKRKKA